MKNLVSVFSLVYYACKVLILVWLFQWWMADAFAMSATTFEQRSNQNLHGDGKFEFKDTIYCHGPYRGQDPYFNGRAASEYFRCPDGTPTFAQPDSTGNAGWNGYCGQTAVSNVAAMMCGRFIQPRTIDTYASDVTPGNLPSTNLKALKILFSENFRSARTSNPCPNHGKWMMYGTRNSARTFLKGIQTLLDNGMADVERRRSDGKLYKITPVPVLLAADISTLHWVTVVDIIDNPEDGYRCDVVMNTWGTQKTMTCTNFVKYGKTALMGYRYLGYVR